MKHIGESKLHVPLWFRILVAIFILIIAFGFLFFREDDLKSASLFAGIVGGLICCIIYFCIDIVSFRKLDEYQRMGVHNLLKNRHDISYYRPIVGSASKRVKVMGSSCSRFIDDFMDIDSDDNVLVDCLQSKPQLIVELLVPEQAFMSEKSNTRFELTSDKIDKLKAKYKDRVSIRRFGFEARHSFVIVDDILIAGPIFHDDQSKLAPAVHVDISTSFGEKYLEYFQSVVKQIDEDNKDKN